MTERMKPTKNRIYCNDCQRVKMLFESEAKALNFMKFNADFIATEKNRVPVRAYYCRCCGGWHVTKHENAGWYREQEEAQDKTIAWRVEIQELTTDFYQNYRADQELSLWQVKMDRLAELISLLHVDGVADASVTRAERCINQFQTFVRKRLSKDKKALAKVRLVPVKELAAQLEQIIYDFRTDGCQALATGMRTLLDAMLADKLMNEEFGKYSDLADMVLDPSRFQVLHQLVVSLKEASDKVLVAKIPLSGDDRAKLEELYRQAESCGIRKSFLKRFKANIHALHIQSDNQQHKMARLKKYDDGRSEQTVRDLLGEVITAMEQGDRQTAEVKLDVAGIHLSRMNHSEARAELVAMADKLDCMLR